MSRKIRLAAVGLGNRTGKYLQYVAEHPDLADLVAVADPDSSKVEEVRKVFSLSDDMVFSSMEDLVAADVNIDACIIATPDMSHAELSVMAMRSGWHVLLEKPMGQTLEQCMDIVKTSRETGRMVTVCYVLRYHPYFVKLKEVSLGPSVGRILSVRHTERVGVDRTAHTFVRGPWNIKEMNTTVFFTKCCHDVDFVLWLVGNDVESIVSEPGSRPFVPANAPEGASSRCIDCPVERSCPYSAVDLYLRRRDWIRGFTAMPGETQDDMICRVLRESRYGRCVYACPENDLPDRHKVTLEMKSGICAEVIMDCLTDATNRVTFIDCEHAVIYGDQDTIEVRYKDGSPTEKYDFRWAASLDYHAGADFSIVEDFLHAISSGSLQTRTLCEESLQSHLVCLQA